MDPQADSNTTPMSADHQPAPDLPKKNGQGITIAALAVFILLSLAAVAFLYYQNQQLKTMLASYQTAPAPTPSATSDATANWKTYTNSAENFSFKYAPTWILDTTQDKGDERGENIQVKLVRGQANLQIYANMVGIGGVGKDFDGTPVVIDGHNLYEYTVDNSYNSTKQIGITDNLKQSLGLFQIQGKTYSITLTYPNPYSNQQAIDLKTEFEQILSTFKFLGPTASPSASVTPSSSLSPSLQPQ